MTVNYKPKLKIMCFLIFCLGSFGLAKSTLAACTGSSPNWSTTADYTSVSTCVSQASAGDTIIVTGNATWTGNTLTFTRGVNLIGSGSPVITSKGVAIYWTPSVAAQTAHDTLKIQGFVIDGNEATGADCNSAGLIRVASGYVDDVTLVVLNNTIKNTQARGLYLFGAIQGVAASNTFDRVGVPYTVGNGDYAGWANWPQVYGSVSAFYFEDNTIQFSSANAGNSGWSESGDGAQIVVRYNTYDRTDTDVTSSEPIWDIHGLQPMRSTGGDPNCAYAGHDFCDPTKKVCQQYSTLTSEFYGNRVINTPRANPWIGQRGGWMLMFNNAYTTSLANPSLSYAQYSCDSCADQGSFVQHVSNTYVWNNFSNATRVSMTKGFDVCADRTTGSPYTITENIDFFNYNASFDGTFGIGCGTLGVLPATCTTGVGYWATNQSCSTVDTASVGAHPSLPISGTLYKCTAPNVWTAYYTPYTYPHPLRNGADTTPPAVPTGLAVH